MPKAEVRRAARTLADVESDLDDLVELLRATGRGSRDGKLKHAAAAARAEAQSAQSSVLNQHPDFRGRNPRQRMVLSLTAATAQVKAFYGDPEKHGR